MSNFRYFYNLEWYEMLKLYDYRSLSCDSNLIRCGESAFMRFMYYFFLCRSICILFIHFKCYNICKSTKKHTSESERSEEHTSELQSRGHLVCRLLLEKKKIT